MPTIANSNAATKREIAALTALHNVAHYGGVIDGVTDDTVAWQSAIDAAEVSGGMVLGPPGTSIITEDLNIDSSNVYIVLSAGSVLKAASGGSGFTNAMLYFNGTIENVGVFGPGKIDGGGVTGALGIYCLGNSMRQIRIEDIEIVDCASRGIQISGTNSTTEILTEVYINNCKIKDALEGILLTNMQYGYITNCTCEDMYTVASSQDCFEVASCLDVVFSNCIGKNPGANNAVFDIFSNAAQIKTDRIVLDNCFAIKDEGTVGPCYGVTTSGTPGIGRVVITNMIIKGGVAAEGTVSGGSTTETSGFGHGLWIAQGDDIVVNGLVIDGIGYSTDNRGFRIEGGANVTINNAFIDHTSGASIQTSVAGNVTLNNCTFKNFTWNKSPAGISNGAIEFNGALASFKCIGCSFLYTGAENATRGYFWPNHTDTGQPFIVTGCYGDGNLRGSVVNPVSPWYDTFRFGVNEFKNYLGNKRNFGCLQGTTGAFTGATVVVTHNGPAAPVASEIMVTPIALGGCTEWYVDTITATQFTINVNPSATNANFAWQINRVK